MKRRDMVQVHCRFTAFPLRGNLPSDLVEGIWFLAIPLSCVLKERSARHQGSQDFGGTFRNAMGMEANVLDSLAMEQNSVGSLPKCSSDFYGDLVTTAVCFQTVEGCLLQFH